MQHLGWARIADAPPGYRTTYLSPLEALAYDVDRNLRTPLAGITTAGGRDAPALSHAKVSSGHSQ